MKDSIRTHVIMPRELIDAVDQVAGRRRRSEFVAEAVAEKLRRQNLRMALRETAGSIDLADYSQWKTPEKTSAWVREMRAVDDEAMERKLSRQRPG